MQNALNTKNKLFLVCPASQLESYIQQVHGQRVYFLTALGAVFDFGQVSYAEAVVDFIDRENIREIWVVNDARCRFVQAVLQQDKGSAAYTREALRDLFVDHYAELTEQELFEDRCISLARLNVVRQVQEIYEHALLAAAISRRNIGLRGLVCMKEKGWNKEIQVRMKVSCS